MRVLLFVCWIVLFNAPLTKADLKPPTKPAEQKVTEPKYILHTGLEIATDAKAYLDELQKLTD